MPRTRLLRARSRPPRTAALPALALAAALTLAAAGCSSATGSPAQGADSAPVATSEVILKGNRFNPANVQVAAGTTVTWRFDDNGVPHDVTGDGWASERLTSGTFTRRFAQPGSYAYRCTLHPGMNGKVTVTG